MRIVGLGPHHKRPFRVLQGTGPDQSIWLPLLFPEGEHESSDDSESDDDDDDDEDDKGEEGSEGSKSEDAKSIENRVKALEEEKSRHYKARKTAEARADELKKQLDEVNAKDTPELEKLKAELAKNAADLKAASEALKETRIERAFLADNTYEWHNPMRALKLADLSETEIEEDGNVTGLKAALDALAKSDPYLLKSKDGEGKKDSAEGKTKTGDSANGSRSKKQGADRAALEAKYPGLRR